MNFTHLHVHSNYSFCRGANTIEQLCAAARNLGYTKLALTDTNGIYGLGWFLQAAKAYRIKPIVGTFLQKDGSSAVVLVKEMSGYQLMCKLISQIHCKSDVNLARQLAQHNKGGIVIITRDENILKTCMDAGNVCDVFVELVPHDNRERSIKLAKKYSLPLVATNAAYFIDQSDYETHRMLRAIDRNTTLSRLAKSELASEHAVLASESDMASRIPDHPEALRNAEKIAEQCSAFSLDFRDFIFPAYRGPNGEDANSYLETKVTAGLHRRYSRITPEIRKRLNYEMEIIAQKGFAPYFLVVADIVAKAPRTCGRGSAAASLVSYALGITHVDPIRYDLFFDRFLNPGRVDPPDIDVDFPWDERDDILDYIFRTYGVGNVAMIANHNSFKARSAVREIAKVYGLPDDEIGKITKKMTGYWQPDSIWSLTKTHPAYKGTDFPDPWPKIIEQAEKIRGYPRHLSIHCGGVVIAPNGVSNYVPIQPAKKALVLTGVLEERSRGLPKHAAPEQLRVIQWEKDQAEDMKLVKMDILGNRSLAVIRDALKAIAKNYNIVIDYARWNPLNDSKTQQLLKEGNTIGVFYVESPAMRLLQQKTGVGDFEHLVIHSSIIRPAANVFINEYIKRLKGAAYKPLHPLLEEILKETFGIMVYQEDVSKVVMALAGFSPVEADDLRKILTKKNKAKKLEDYRTKFFLGTREKKLDDTTAEKIWTMIMSFSGYSFCKPHSASYALVSFKSAYLKAYYPAEFIAAVITNQGGYYSTFAYISEARRMGLQVLMPDINASEREYVGVSKSIRVGFMQLKGMASKSIERILAERKKSPFYSLDDFIQRVNLSFAELAILVKSGCLDGLAHGKTRPQMLWHIKLNFKSVPSSETLSLFDEPQRREPPDITDYDDSTVLRHEIETLGFLISKHPLSLYEQKIKNLDLVKGRDLKKYAGKKVKTLGWYITGKVTSTKNNDLMEFLSFEDTTAIYEATFFPKAFARFVHMISHSRPYVLHGKVEEHYGAVTLTVDYVDYL